MRTLVRVGDIGLRRQRDLVQHEIRSATFEHQYAGSIAQPRRKAALTNDHIAAFVFDAISDHLGEPADWSLSETLRTVVPPLERWRFAGVSPHFTVYRYERGDSFANHRDEERQVGPTRWTALSLLLYLPSEGDALVGGETFVDCEKVEPEPWSVVVFAHHTWHHSAEVISGSKLVVRGDVTIEPVG